MVRSIEEAKMEDFCLPDNVLERLRDISARDLVKYARAGKLAELLQDDELVPVIYNAVDAAGFIFCESERSWAYRCLLRAILRDNADELVGKPMRYEDQVEISEENQMIFNRILDYITSIGGEEKYAVRDLFGLNDGFSRTMAKKELYPHDENLRYWFLLRLRSWAATRIGQVQVLLWTPSFASFRADLKNELESQIEPQTLRCLEIVYGEISKRYLLEPVKARKGQH